MYPRNAGNPERVAIGAVIQISDGAVQTSDVSIKVKPQGGSASAGGGTVSYEEGIVGYIPTQAETNSTSFQLIAYKSGCIPASITVVTSASVIPGKVIPADDSITASVFDESTAFPLKSADTGNTQVSRTGADGDTLEILSDQIDSISSQISGIGSGTGAALNFAITEDNASTPIKSVTAVGTQTGTFANTLADDNTTHQIASVTNAIDWVYGANVGAGRSATKAVISGNMLATGDTVTVSAYNFGTTSWDARATITGTTKTLRDVSLLSGHTGTSGADLGKVYIRFQFSEADAGNLVNDLVYIQAQQSGSLIGYADGAVWVKATGTSGTTPYQNGTADNPCPWANAVVIAAALGLARFRILPDETVTLAASLADKTVIGEHWYLNLGGQQIDDCYIKGAVVSGVATGTDHSIYEDCEIGTGVAGATVPPGKFMRCGFNTPTGQPFTAASAGQYVFTDCFSLVAGSGTPYFTFSGACGVNFRRWSGGSNTTLNNTGSAMTMEVVAGGGQTIACGGADVEIRGICRAVTLTGITTDTTAQIAAVTGPISVSGADGIVRVYGVHSGITDTRTGTPTLVNMSTASQSSVDDLPTNSELATALAGADDAVLLAISALNNLSAAGAQAAAAAALAAYDAATGSDVPSAATNAAAVRTELATELSRMDVAVSSRLAASSYTAPANSDITAIKAKTDNLPPDPADASVIASAISGLASTLTTIQGYVDDLETRLTSSRAGYLDKLNVTGTLAHSDAAATYRADVSLVALESTAQALKVVLDKLATMLEQDGGVYRYTVNALEQAPSGGGSSPEVIAEAVRVELATELAHLDEDVSTRASQTSVDEIIDRIEQQVPEGPVIVVPTPTDPTQTVGWILCLDENGAPEVGVTITVQLTWRSLGELGYAYDMTPVVATSGADGFAYVILPRGATLQFIGRRDLGKRKYFYGSDADSFQLPALIGTE